MTVFLLICLIAGGLWYWGFRTGKKRIIQPSTILPSELDRAPKNYQDIACEFCAIPIPCRIQINLRHSNGKKIYSADIDRTDYDLHVMMKHVEKV